MITPNLSPTPLILYLPQTTRSNSVYFILLFIPLTSIQEAEKRFRWRGGLRSSRLFMLMMSVVPIINECAEAAAGNIVTAVVAATATLVTAVATEFLVEVVTAAATIVIITTTGVVTESVHTDA